MAARAAGDSADRGFSRRRHAIHRISSQGSSMTQTTQAPPPIEKLDRNFAPTEVADGLHWFDAAKLGVVGRGWTDTEHPFDRLPARAKGVVRDPVWQLSHHSAG